MNTPIEELSWLQEVIKQRLQATGNTEKLLSAPAVKKGTPYNEVIIKQNLDTRDRLLLILALAPHVSPQFLDEAIKQNINTDGDYPQLGGVRSASFRGLLPTAETFLFLAAGVDSSKRLKTWHWLRNSSKLYENTTVRVLRPQNEGDPPQSGILSIDADKAEELLYGESAPPPFSMEFPARKIATNLTWDDLVLSPQTRKQLEELKDWLEVRDQLNNFEIGKRIKKGYRALFHGPPGTGKTLAASLLGRYTNTEVFLVDLSMVVSKYIGETEKNLSLLFNKAQNKNWILFFDEADALFGKRTNVRDAHDKYANQEVSYLLQRVEDFPGLVILASNLKGNIDEAFLRRFQSVIHFPLPGLAERVEIWKEALKGAEKSIDHAELRNIARKHELSGANIINAAHYAFLRATAEKRNVCIADVQTGIMRELLKEGKIA